MDLQKVHDRRWLILGVLCISLLVVVLDNTILNVALPTIQKDLHASQGEQEWMIDAYTLVFAGLLFTLGVLGDRLGRRRMLVAGLVGFALASLVSAYATTSLTLIAARAVMGIGGAAIMPSTLSILTNVFDADERPKAIAIWAGTSGMAIGVGPIVGGLLLSHFWWGSVFLVNVPIALLGLFAIYSLIPESRDPNPHKLDPLGVVLSVVGLVALVYGIIRGGQTNHWTSTGVLAPVLLGVVVLMAFVWVERHSDHPSIDVTLFRRPAFSAATAAITLAFFALFGATFFLTFYLQFVRMYSPLDAGLRLIPVAFAIMFFAPRSARLARRFGAKAVVTFGMFVVTAAFAMYHFLAVDSPIWYVEVVLFVQGLGMAHVMAPATESIMSTLPRERAGAGSAVNNTVRQVGGALGVAVIGSLLSAVYRNQITPHLSALPAAARDKAGESLGATLGVIGRLGPQAHALVDPANNAYMHALHVASLGSAAVAFVGGLVSLIWLPGRGGPLDPQPVPASYDEDVDLPESVGV